MTQPAIKSWNPSAEQQRAFQSSDATFEWLCALPKDLLRQYSGKWVAAKDCRIVAAADSLDSLLGELGDTDLQSLIICANSLGCVGKMESGSSCTESLTARNVSYRLRSMGWTSTSVKPATN